MASWFGLGKQPNDYHPPHNICRGETFLAELYNTIRKSPYRDKILLLITFDEHGGCFDHVPPPTGAKPPMPSPVSRDGEFHFDRFGVRVPAIVVSSYVESGTVFRAADNQIPYDHTSIPATLGDWLSLASDPANFFRARGSHPLRTWIRCSSARPDMKTRIGRRSNQPAKSMVRIFSLAPDYAELLRRFLKFIEGSPFVHFLTRHYSEHQTPVDFNAKAAENLAGLNNCYAHN